MGDIVENRMIDNSINNIRRVIVVQEKDVPIFEFILTTAWYDYLLQNVNKSAPVQIRRSKSYASKIDDIKVGSKVSNMIFPHVKYQVSQDKSVTTYPGFDARIYVDQNDMKEVFRILKIELSKLILLLKRAGLRLESLRRLSLSNINWVTMHFRDLSKLSQLYSWKELSRAEAGEIDRLINSDKKEEVEEGRKRVLEVKAKEALQIVYQNQYGSYIPRDVDMYAGPRACMIS